MFRSFHASSPSKGQKEHQCEAAVAVLATTAAVNCEFDKIIAAPDSIPDSELKPLDDTEPRWHCCESDCVDSYFEMDADETTKAKSAAGLRSSAGQRPQKLLKLQDRVLFTLYDILMETGLWTFQGSLATQGEHRCVERFELLRPWLRKFIACCRMEEGFLSPAQVLGCVVGKRRNEPNKAKHLLRLARDATSGSSQNQSRLANFATSMTLIVWSANKHSNDSKKGDQTGAQTIKSFRSSCVLKEELVIDSSQRHKHLRSSGKRDYQILVCKPDGFAGLWFGITQTVFRGSISKVKSADGEPGNGTRSMLGSRPFIHPLAAELAKFVHVKVLRPVAGAGDRFFATAFSPTVSLEPLSPTQPILYEVPEHQFKIEEVGNAFINVQIFWPARSARANLSKQLGSSNFQKLLAEATGKTVPDPAAAAQQAWNKRIFGRIPVPTEAFHRDSFPWNREGRANMKALMCVMAKMLQSDMAEPIVTEDGAYRFCPGSSWTTMLANASEMLHEVQGRAIPGYPRYQ